MGAIQGSINQGIATIGTIAGIGKHVKEQKVANELAKQKEATDILNQLPDMEYEENIDLEDKIGQQANKYQDLLNKQEAARVVGRQDLVDAANPEIEKQGTALRILTSKQAAMKAQRERLEGRLKDISNVDYADIREKSKAVLDKHRKEVHNMFTEVVNTSFPNRDKPTVNDDEINATLDKLIGGDK